MNDVVNIRPPRVNLLRGRREIARHLVLYKQIAGRSLRVIETKLRTDDRCIRQQLHDDRPADHVRRYRSRDREDGRTELSIECRTAFEFLRRSRLGSNEGSQINVEERGREGGSEHGGSRDPWRKMRRGDVL